MSAGASVSPDAEPGIGIGELLAGAAAAFPERTAIVDSGSVLTYEEFATSVARLAGALHKAGVVAGERVGLWLPNTTFWLQAHVALARLGAIVVGINARYPVREVARIARAAEITTLVVDTTSRGVADADALRELAAEPGLRIRAVLSASGPVTTPDGWTCWDGRAFLDEEGDSDVSLHGRAVSPDAPCAVFASSGSTGDPKLIVHSQRGIARHSRAIAASFGYTRRDTVVLGQLPLCGVWGFNTVYAAIAAAATVVLMQRFDAAEAVRQIEQHQVTTANGPDLFLRQLFGAAEDDPARLASLRDIGFSTFSNDGPELVAWGDRLGVALFQVYGSSEQQALMVHRPAEAPPELRADAGGLPSDPSTRMRIRHPETGELVPVGVTGALETSGPNVMLGYLTRDGVDRSAFTDDGWLRTGDIGELDDDGLRFFGREKDALRLSGFLVDPREIEVRIEECPGIAEAKVVGVETGRGPKCVAFVRYSTSGGPDEERLLLWCRDSLASYKVPIRIFPVTDFPRVDGANGPRIQRLALRELAAERTAQ
jgi:fatty-acyl-CoA synthase